MTLLLTKIVQRFANVTDNAVLSYFVIYNLVCMPSCTQCPRNSTSVVVNRAAEYVSEKLI